MRVIVVLPAPLRPTSPTLSPGPIRNDASSTSTRAPARTWRWGAVIIGGGLSGRIRSGCRSRGGTAVLLGTSDHGIMRPGYRPEESTMKINPKARIDRGRVRVRRGGGRSGGFPKPCGGGSGGGSGLPIPTGGGIVGIVLVVILLIVLAQCNGGIPGMGGSTSDSGSDEA